MPVLGRPAIAICGRSAVSGAGVLGGGQAADPVQDRGHAPTAAGRNRQRRTQPEAVKFGRQLIALRGVALVDQQQARDTRTPHHRGHRQVLGGHPQGGVGHDHEQVGVRNGAPRQLVGGQRQFIALVGKEPGGIHQEEGLPAVLHAPVGAIAGRAGLVFDHRVP